MSAITIRNRWIIAIFWDRWPWKCPRYVTAAPILWWHWFSYYAFIERAKP